MEGVTYALVLGVGVVGIAASLVAALRLLNVNRLIGDRGLTLEAVSLALYAVALAVEAASLAASLVSGPPSWAPGRFHREVFMRHELSGTPLLQASLLAGYIYVVAYAVHAVSLYTSMNPEKQPLLPVLAVIYTDYNIIALMLVAVTLYMLVAVYKASRQAVSYHSLIAASHVVGAVYAALPSTLVILASFALRGIAPILLHLPGRRGTP